MSDEEESMSEGFSASEDEWVPNKDLKGGESSDDDDSDFEGSPLTGATNSGRANSGEKKRHEPKARSAVKQTSKKRSGLSLRAKLYNKYRPPPKTASPSSSVASKNYPIASTSRTNSKNLMMPNESKSKHKTNDGKGSDSSSDSSIGNYLVNFEDLDIQSSFFNVGKNSSASPAPAFECDVSQENLSISSFDGAKDLSKLDENTFDFKNLVEYAKCMERFKESVAKHNAEEAKKKSVTKNIDTLDVYSVLALGEKNNRSHNDAEDEDDEDDECLSNETKATQSQSVKLNKTKSTRIKRHTKTRPSSTVAANDTDDSDWEEVPDSSKCVNATANSISSNLEIHVELPNRNGEKKTKTQQDIEMALKRRLNRDIKERQVLLHKASLLCRFGRTIFYNRLLNNTILMQKVLELLPSKTAYPSERGTEIKYFQSMVTWFKSAIKLKTNNLYPENSASKTKSKALAELLKQINNKDARCKQDMIFIFIILLRGMGLQCRLIVNMQPLPLRPVPSDLLAIKIKKNAESKNKSIAKIVTSSNKKTDQQTVSIKEIKNEIKKRSMQDVKNEEPSIKTGTWPDNSKVNTKSINKIKSKKVQNKLTQNVGKKICNNNGNGGKTKYKTVTKNLQQIENKTENGNEAAQKFQKQGNVCTTPEANDVVINFAFSQTNDESLNSAKCKQDLSEENLKDLIVKCNLEEQQNSRKVRLKPEKSKVNNSALEKRPNKEAIIETKLGAIPKKTKSTASQ